LKGDGNASRETVRKCHCKDCRGLGERQIRQIAESIKTLGFGAGEPMTREDADYAIDKSLASGLLDSSGGLNFTAKGFTREEVAGQIIERSTAWGQPVGREDAEHMASRGIRHIWYRRILKTVVILIFCMAGVAIVLLTQGS
jgi:hypothetical protein